MEREGSLSPKRGDEEVAEHTDELGEEEMTYDDSEQLGGDTLYVVKELSKDFVIFRWKLRNFSSLQNKFYSKPFSHGENDEHTWRLYFHPRGNTNHKFMALYLDVPGAASKPYSWTRYAEFRLGCINQKDIRKSKFQESRKTFRREVVDWGFGEFMPLKDINEETGFLKDDTLLLEVRIEVKKNEFSGYAFAGYDSRKETGFVGIQNQGATCYLNSVIQTLYHLSGFRRAVFHMDVSDVEDTTKSIPMALQQLFYNMQFSQSSVSTSGLTTSFGWGAADSFVQHDVQELLRVLLDNLSEKMKSTPLEGTIDSMFSGKLKNYLQCVNVDYGSSWLEPFYDVQLVVKGKKNLMESFEAYCEVEMLDGENQYEAEGFGKQDAKKGVLFNKLPPVLVTHLKRFEYDWQYDRAYKVNDRFEFPVDVNLQQFMAEDGELSVPNEYSLLSILVHSGGAQGGHYYAYIRPGCKGDRWLKFDDERVTPASTTEAVEENFGGEEKPMDEKSIKSAGYPNWDVPVGHVQRFRSVFKRYANAYMLVFVRTADMGEYLREVEEEEIPEEMRARFEEEERREAERRQAEKEKHMYRDVRFFTEEDLAERDAAFGLFDITGKGPEERVIRIKKTDPLKNLLEPLSERAGIPLEELRLWKIGQVALPRPDKFIRTGDLERSIDLALDMSMYMYSYSYGDKTCLFVQRVAPESEQPGINQRMLFFKFYDFATESMRVLGSRIVENNIPMQEVAREVLEAAGLNSGREILLFRETKASVLPLRGDSSVRDARLESGDPIIIQWDPTEQEKQEFEYFNAQELFRFEQNRKAVRIAKLEEPEKDEFTLNLSLTMTYDEVTDTIGAKIGAEGKFIRLTAHSSYLKEPRKTPLMTSSRNLREMLYYANSYSDKLYYEIMDEPVKELENKKEINVQFYNSRAEKEKAVKLVVPRRGCVADLFAKAREKLEIPEKQEIRLGEVYNGKFTKIFREVESVEFMRDSSYNILRLELVGPEEEVPEGGKLVQVVHFCKDHISIQAFGNPFFLAIGPDETFASVRERVLAKLEFEAEEVDKWNLGTLMYSKTNVVKREDEDKTAVLAALAKVEYSHTPACIGLEHENPDPEDTVSYVTQYPSSYRRGAGHQAAIKIHN